ncbi:hypothetical protein V8U06_06090 [Shinella sp. G-2]
MQSTVFMACFIAPRGAVVKRAGACARENRDGVNCYPGNRRRIHAVQEGAADDGKQDVHRSQLVIVKSRNSTLRRRAIKI